MDNFVYNFIAFIFAINGDLKIMKNLFIILIWESYLKAQDGLFLDSQTWRTPITARWS
jgi:hypothetical protein